MPSAPALSSLFGSVAALVLVVLGVQDANMAAAVQGVAVGAGGLVVSVAIYCHHRTRQNADTLSVQAAQVAAQAAQAAQAARAASAGPVTPAGSPPAGLAAFASPTLLAQLGAAVEASRAGVVAVAPVDPVTPAAVLAPAVAGVLPGDDAGPYLHAPAHAAPDEFPTDVMPAVPALP